MVGYRFTINGINWNWTPYTGALPAGVSHPPSVSPPPPPALPPVSTGSGLLNNGSFENPVVPAGTWTGFNSIPGWTMTNLVRLINRVMLPAFGGFGTDGVQYAELSNNLSQTVTLPAGKTYRLTVDYRYGDEGTLADNRFLLHWDGKQLADVQPIPGSGGAGAGAQWQRMTFPIRGSGTPITLRFSQPTPVLQGPFLDRVRIVQDNALTPPANGCPGGLPLPPPPPPTPAVPPTPLRIIR